MRKFKGEQLLANEVYATPLELDFAEVSHVPSVKYKDLGQRVHSYKVKRALINSERQQMVANECLEFKLPPFPVDINAASVPSTTTEQPILADARQSEEGLLPTDVTKEKTEFTSQKRISQLFKGFDVPKIRKGSFARSISESLSSSSQPPAFVKKLQHRFSSVKVDESHSSDSTTRSDFKTKITPKEAQISLEPAVSETIADQSVSVADISDQISLLSIGTIESLLNGYMGDLEDFLLLHQRQESGTSSFYDSDNNGIVFTSRLAPPPSFTLAGTPTIPSSPSIDDYNEQANSVFSYNDSGNSSVSDSLSFTSSTNFRTPLKTTYSHKPLPTPPIISFNQNEIRSYDSQKRLTIEDGTPPPVPKHQFPGVMLTDRQSQQDTKWGEDADAAIPNQKVTIPHDTSVFTRKPTYSKAKKQFGDIPILSTRVDKSEEKQRSSSLQYLEQVGIEPFMLGGYQECKKLHITNA